MTELHQRVRSLLFALVLLAILPTSLAAAQSQDNEVPGPPRAQLVRQGDQQPTLTQPLYLMVPGVVALVVGGIMFSQYPEGVDYEAYDGASIGLMSAGTVLMAGSLVYFGVRIAKRVRRCSEREPQIYQPLYMFARGGAGRDRHGAAEQRREHLRVLPVCTCSKLPKMRSWCSGAMPMPWSRTQTTSACALLSSLRRHVGAHARRCLDRRERGQRRTRRT